MYQSSRKKNFLFYEQYNKKTFNEIINLKTKNHVDSTPIKLKTYKLVKRKTNRGITRLGFREEIKLGEKTNTGRYLFIVIVKEVQSKDCWNTKLVYKVLIERETAKVKPTESCDS